MKIKVVALAFAILWFCLPGAGQTGFSIQPNIPGNITQICGSELVLFPNLTLEGNPSFKGMKVSISEGYRSTEDQLYLIKTGKIDGAWNATTGSLVLTNGESLAEYQEALRQVGYRNTSVKPTNAARKITITLDDADYLPHTQHFYRFISRPGLRWSEAKAEAESDAMMLFGLRGYLATITSYQENDFIRQKTKGVGWIGASDAASEGFWRWVTGPEALQETGGLLFWKGSGYQAKLNNPAGVYGPVNGAYHNWNKWDTGFSSTLAQTTWEPNDVGDGIGTENYGHITFFPNNSNDSFKWNDLPDAGGNGDYASQGYLIEYGGMPGDPTINLTATIELQVNTIWFDDKRDFTICEGEKVTLNRADNSASYFWSPAEGLSSPSVANPEASPKTTTTYLVNSSRGICNGQANFTVNVKPLPVSLLHATENICEGKSIILNPGIHQNYLWSNGATTPTIEITEPGSYSVTLTNNGCQTVSSSQVNYHTYPKLDLSDVQTLICGSKTTLLEAKTDKGDFTVSGQGSSQAKNDLNLTVDHWGKFSYIVKAEDQYGCATELPIEIGFFKTPTAAILIDENDGNACYGYNIKATYQGDAEIAITNFIWTYNRDTIIDALGVNAKEIPLGINRDERNLKLTINENGCSASAERSDIAVTPLLDFAVENKIGCVPFEAKFATQNTENVTQYDWNWGDGLSDSTSDGIQTHSYQSEGFYPVRLKVTTDQGCINEVKIDSMVYAAPIPEVAFSIDASTCLEYGVNTLEFAGIALPTDTYQWDLTALAEDEIISNPQSSQGPLQFDLKHKPSATVGLKVISTYGCESIPKTITVKRKPAFSFSATPPEGCIPLNVSFAAEANDAVDQLLYTWNFGNNETATGSNATAIYSEANRNYNVTLSAQSSTTGCNNQIALENHITTYPQPEAAFSMDHEIVYNDAPSVKFTNTSVGATSFLWNFGNDRSTEKDPAHNFSGFGKQEFSLIAYSDKACSDTLAGSVSVLFNKIFAPNAFSPNAPNPVDREFKLKSGGIKEEGYNLVIMSRWNDIVFETKNQIIGWNGTTKDGKAAPSGTYVWVLKYFDYLDRAHQQTGTVTLIY